MYFGMPPWNETKENDRTFRYYKSNMVNLFKYHGGVRQKFAAGEINEDLISLISSLLSYNAVDRPEINDIASHSFFQNIEDLSDEEAASKIHSLLVDSE
jgi:serine/threonine protein kinase